jgi:4-hydroxy-tetrahydrodipicolinate synthase
MNNIHDAPRPRLRGVIAAIVTPLAKAGPDHARMIALGRHLLDSGCDGLNVLGTTGEATSFSVEERMEIMRALAEAKLPMHRLMAGTGAAALSDAISLSRHAAALGFGGILLLPPFYYKSVTDDGIVAYVGRVVEATAETEVPIYLYNFPALAGVAYTLPLVAELLSRFGTRIAGLKDSSGDPSYAKAVAALSNTLDVFPSNEANLLSARSGTFAGCISATANINSGDCARAYNSGDQAALSRAIAVRKVFDGIPLIPGIKFLLSQIHSDPHLAEVMPPLSGLTPYESETIRARFRSVLSEGADTHSLCH